MKNTDFIFHTLVIVYNEICYLPYIFYIYYIYILYNAQI